MQREFRGLRKTMILQYICRLSRRKTNSVKPKAITKWGPPIWRRNILSPINNCSLHIAINLNKQFILSIIYFHYNLSQMLSFNSVQFQFIPNSFKYIQTRVYSHTQNTVNTQYRYCCFNTDLCLQFVDNFDCK